MVNPQGVSSRNLTKYVAGALFIALGLTPALAQVQRSLVTDWSSHHVVYSDPGSEMDALMNGKRQDWQNLQNSPRFRMQQFRRSAAYANRPANAANRHDSRYDDHNSNSMSRDWAVPIAGIGLGTAQGMYPAVYDADFAVPSCTGDFVVFPVNALGESGLLGIAAQPNIVGLTNLYKTTCSGTNPTVKFAYFIATANVAGATTGTVNTSPALSIDGTQIAFVANVGTHAYFFVVTPANITPAGTTAAPTFLSTAGGTGYTAFELDHGANDTLSSPYIDYTTNTAYVGDNSGYVHKIQNVFGTTAPSEIVTAGEWPARPSGGAITLTGAIYDSQAKDVFVGGSNGHVYCITASVGGSCGNLTVATATGETGGTAGAVTDAPIVLDNGATSGTTGWVFSQAVYATQVEGTPTEAACTVLCLGDAYTWTYPWKATDYAVLAQAPISGATGISSATGVSIGTVAQTNTNTKNSNSRTTPPTGTAAYPTLTTSNLYGGDFDNTFYNSSASSGYSGHLYACGTTGAPANGTTGHSIPELYQVGFNSTGAINGSATAVYTLATNNTASQASGCSGLTEFYNASANSNAGADYLFLSVSGYGAYTACTSFGCVMNFTLPSSGVPSGPIAGLPLSGNGNGTSGLVIDNGASTPGASQIYFSNLQTGNATQASQAALQ
jgi:hypothetical protein